MKMASMTTSAQSSGVSSTSAGHEATPGNYEYPDYYYDYYGVYEYEMIIKPRYSFERPEYMYIWSILVIITFLANILVISVLLRKKMRNPTNMILTAIAISDSLTGLVTLPSYWAVYSTFQPAENYNLNDTSAFNFSQFYVIADDNSTIYEYISLIDSRPSLSYYSDTKEVPVYDNQKDYHRLTTELCRAYTISKYFLFQTFHTVSIWLTLFLGFQRFISVAAPHRAKILFCKKNVLIIGVVIALAAPLLHVYHLVDEKDDNEEKKCQWGLKENVIAHLIITFLLRHFVPCILLVIFTVLFIIHLTKSSPLLNRINRGNASMHHRDIENRRISLIVTLIVIVFLIPEIPYGGFLLYAIIGKLKRVSFNLETNSAIHLAYEVSVVVSFHANFYIYTFFNRRFRKGLLRGIVYPILTCCGRSSWCGIAAIKDMHSGTSYTTTNRRRTLQRETGTRIKLNNIGTYSNSAARSTSVTEASQFVNGKPHEEQENIDKKKKCLSQESDLHNVNL